MPGRRVGDPGTALEADPVVDFGGDRWMLMFVDGKAGACRGPGGLVVLGLVALLFAAIGLHGEGRIGESSSLFGCSKTLNFEPISRPSEPGLVGIKAQRSGYAKGSPLIALSDESFGCDQKMSGLDLGLSESLLEEAGTTAGMLAADVSALRRAVGCAVGEPLSSTKTERRPESRLLVGETFRLTSTTWNLLGDIWSSLLSSAASEMCDGLRTIAMTLGRFAGEIDAAGMLMRTQFCLRWPRLRPPLPVELVEWRERAMVGVRSRRKG
jgi:hypothetical protein